VVHGYGASGAIQYKIFKHLSDHFNLYMIDLIGMGSSSRPVFECTTGAEADIYMIEYLEKWRIAMNNMTGFILAGSSYGGYLVGTYAAKYPQHISKLLLLSPLGLKIPPDGWTPDRSGFRQGT
jgi:cardiolipin-specific phospholipase